MKIKIYIVCKDQDNKTEIVKAYDNEAQANIFCDLKNSGLKQNDEWYYPYDADLWVNV